MYPFNRADNNLAQNASVAVDMDPIEHIQHQKFIQIEQNGNAAHYRRRSNVSQKDVETSEQQNNHFEAVQRKSTVNGSLIEDRKNVLADLLEISFSRKSWNFRGDKACDIEQHGLFMGLGRNIHAITNKLRYVLILLRCLSYFPGFVRYEKREQQQIKIYRLVLYSMLGISILANLYFFRHNIYMLMIYHEKFGFLHALTVSTIITGIKPLINIVLLLMFFIRFNSHLKMLRMFDTLDLSFRSAFNISPPIKLYSCIFLAATTFSMIIPLCYRIFEMIKEDASMQVPKTVFEWATDVSFIVVPLLTAWNMLPLFYYVLANRIVCFWCRTLKNSLKKEHLQRQFSLKFYYEQFLRVAALQKSIGSLFNPFVFFSLAWSLLMLSLTIYFVTQPTSSLTEPITVKQISLDSMRRFLTERVYLNLGWSAIQICIAILHICIICATGMKTNEETRKIINTVLAIVPDANADLDRFQISCFVHKLSFQHMWGMTVWRTFPLERTTFFTLISVIFTYSFLLLKLKDNPTLTPIVRQIVHMNSNSTSC